MMTNNRLLITDSNGFLGNNLVKYFAGLALTLITMPIMTRLLTPADYGIIMMSSLFPTIVVGVLTYCRDLPRQERDCGKV